MAARAFPQLPWTELVRRTVRDTIDDECPALAAQLSYYLCLAFFPALLFLLGILIGAERNAELERATPYGAAALTDATSGRRVIGPRAARLFERLGGAPSHQTDTAASSSESPERAPAPASVVSGLAFTAIVLALRGPRRVLGKSS